MPNFEEEALEDAFDDSSESGGENEVAIVGMAGRFPKAPDVETFWRNLCDGVEGITFFERDELLEAGVDEATLDDPSYIPAAAVLDDIELFDARLFGFSAREAALLDPQQRLFLQIAWQAFETAGVDPMRFPGPIGAYAGVSMNSYFLYQLFGRLSGADTVQVMLGSDKDFFTTRVAYKLGLRGPAMNVQTACSSSLVAVHLACQSLLNGECDLALAGGASVRVPHRMGYAHQPGGLFSPDGHCRAFDAEAGGTVVGNGMGAVVLKRLEDALEDGDPIRAVIRATAVNNDGALKVGFSAPSVEGQAAVITEALALAQVEAEDIGYIETHGTATPLGDSIEMAALNHAFRAHTEAEGFCALGSVKTNIGHLDAAAGITGLIKTALTVEHGQIPPSLGFRTPNPRCGFDGSPFFVNSELRPWSDGPRIAGVSSFGMGGTNAHAILEQAPEGDFDEIERTQRPHQVLVLSAATDTALDTATDNLAAWLRDQGQGQEGSASASLLADAAFTLQTGRRLLRHRRAVVASSLQEGAELLAERAAGRVLQDEDPRTDRPVAFLLSGLGDHYPNLARRLYEKEPLFRAEVDRYCELLTPELGEDLRPHLFPGRIDELPQTNDDAGPNLRAMLRGAGPDLGTLTDTRLAQPALFVVELALARLWQAWGVTPSALLGYSLGEYVAATLAGVLSNTDALQLVARRARLIATLGEGAMLALSLDEASVRQHLADELASPEESPAPDRRLSISAVNGPALTVVSGTPEAIEAAEARLTRDLPDVSCRRLPNRHAFHSHLLQPIADQLRDLVRGFDFGTPQIPYISNVSGTWITDEQASDPDYWVEHLLAPVRFADGVHELWRETSRLLLEVGPGANLASLALQLPHEATADAETERAQPEGRLAFGSLPGAHGLGGHQDDRLALMTALGRLWLAGVPVDWAAVHTTYSAVDPPARPRRVALPTYPFEGQRHWIEGTPQLAGGAAGGATLPSADGTDSPAGRGVSTTVHTRPKLPTPYRAATSASELALAQLWQELLGVEPVGVDDNFFDLGGHSLLATQLIARLQRGFGVEVELAQLFERPTVARLAELVPSELPSGKGLTATETGPELPAIPRRPDPETAPLSFAQQRLWFIDQLAPGIAAYNNPTVVRLKGNLDARRLEAGLDAIVARHETLRTTFELGKGAEAPLQRIHAHQFQSLPVVDLQALPADQRETVAAELMDACAQRPFYLDREASIHTLLLRLDTRNHMLAAVLHHIISDEWSLGLLVGELAGFYQAQEAGREPRLAELPVQYADYAYWQRELERSGELQPLLDFWHDQLDGAPPVLDLPLDRPRPAMQSFRGADVHFELPAKLSQALLLAGRQHGVTLFMTLLSALAVTLSRLGHQRDLVISSGTGTRPRQEIENLIGCFINILLLRTRLDDNPSFADLLTRVRTTTLDAFARQDVPFELLVEMAAPERDLSHNPLTQVMLVLLNVPRSEIGVASDLTLEPQQTKRASAQLDLTWYLMEVGDLASGEGKLAGRLEYASDLFDASTIRRMLRHFQTVLEQLVEDPARRVQDFDLLSGAERQLLLHEVNDTRSAFPHDRCLHEVITEHVATRPEATAILAGEQSYSYRQLHDRARRLARQLRDLGVGPESRVGLALQRGADVPTAILGVLEAGACYVPLDVSYPEERVRFLLEDAGVEVIVTHAVLRSSLPEVRAEILEIDELSWDGEDAEDDGQSFAPCDPENLAYLIYTSGSTGTPKAVAIRHRGVLNNLVDLNTSFGVGTDSRILQLSSLSFDMSVYETLGTLVAGGTIVFPDPDLDRDPGHWADLVAQHRITVWNTAPSLLGLLIDYSEQHAEEGTVDLSSLRVAILGGDWVPIPLVERTRAAVGNPAFRFIVLGGATESSIHSIVYPVGALQESWRSIPYGWPMRNQSAHLVDRCMRPVPLGGAGELLLGGIGLARGYAGRPRFTAERFLPDPFATERVTSGTRLYRTGDLARTFANGCIELLGRMDFQVKIHGLRVELGEIEAVLKAQPGVEAAVVAVREVRPGDHRLVAYVTGESGPQAESLRAPLKEQLPDYMVPSHFLTLDTLPLSPNGKVDRRALPLPDAQRPELAAEYAPPTHVVEEALVLLYQDILGLDRVGIHDDFFDLGGHSLLATRLINRLQEAFVVEVPLRQVFEAPTPATLGAWLQTTGEEQGLDMSEIADVYLQVTQMSSDEVAAMLEEEALGEED